MTITVPSVLILIGIVQLALASLKVADLSRWSWFPGGALFVALGVFVNAT